MASGVFRCHFFNHKSHKSLQFYLYENKKFKKEALIPFLNFLKLFSESSFVTFVVEIKYPSSLDSVSKNSK